LVGEKFLIFFRIFRLRILFLIFGIYFKKKKISGKCFLCSFLYGGVRILDNTWFECQFCVLFLVFIFWKIIFIFKFLRFINHIYFDLQNKYLSCYHSIFTYSKKFKTLICCFQFLACFLKYFLWKYFLNFNQMYFHSYFFVLFKN